MERVNGHPVFAAGLSSLGVASAYIDVENNGVLADCKQVTFRVTAAMWRDILAAGGCGLFADVDGVATFYWPAPPNQPVKRRRRRGRRGGRGRRRPAP